VRSTTAAQCDLAVEGGGEVVVIAAQSVWDIEEFHNEEATPANVGGDDLRDAAVASIRRHKALRPGAAYLGHHPGVYRAS